MWYKSQIVFDYQIGIYELHYSGLVKKVKRPGGRYTQYTYDKLYRVIRADYQDKSYEAYVYNKNGLLTEAKNQYITIKLEPIFCSRVKKMGHGSDIKFYVVEVDDLNTEGVKIKSRNTIRADRNQQVLGGCR